MLSFLLFLTEFVNRPVYYHFSFHQNCDQEREREREREGKEATVRSIHVQKNKQKTNDNNRWLLYSANLSAEQNSGRLPVIYCISTSMHTHTHNLCSHSSGAVWESRWPPWAVRPNEPSGFCGLKAILNHASALVSACPEYVSWHLRTLSNTTYLPLCSQKWSTSGFHKDLFKKQLIRKSWAEFGIQTDMSRNISYRLNRTFASVPL